MSCLTTTKLKGSVKEISLEQKSLFRARSDQSATVLEESAGFITGVKHSVRSRWLSPGPLGATPRVISEQGTMAIQPNKSRPMAADSRLRWST